MTLPTYALKYWACTAEEMHTFIKDRTGTNAEPRKRREVYLQILRQLDEEARFPRFLELPPELREFVYLELLQNDALRRFPFTEILRASKLIYKESLPVLHDNSTVRLKALFFHRGDPDETGARTANAKLGCKRRYNDMETRFSSSMTTLQAATWLHPFSNLRVFNVALQLSGSVRFPTQQWALPPRFLEALVQTCKRARRLLLYVYDDVSGNSAERLVEALTPLRQLPVTCRLLLVMDGRRGRENCILGDVEEDWNGYSKDREAKEEPRREARGYRGHGARDMRRLESHNIHCLFSYARNED